MAKLFKNEKRKHLILTLTISLVIMSIISISYAVFTVNIIGEKKFTLTVGTLDFKIEDEKNSIRLLNAYPMTDEEGNELTPYVFTLTNTGTLSEYYKVSLILDEDSRSKCTNCEFLDTSKLRYSLTVDGITEKSKTLSDETILDLGTIASGVSKKYELRIWLNKNATIEEENKYYYGKIRIDTSQEEYEDDTKLINTLGLEGRVDTSTKVDFSKPSSETNGRGIYKYTEDGEDIYYWRGAVTDNHVIFGGYCWEMIRTTKTGGVKMIYDGEPVDGKCTNTGTASNLSAGYIEFNKKYNDNAYVGYMYGLTGLSSELSSAQCIKLSSTGTAAEVGEETDETSCKIAGGKWVTTAYEATHANVVNSNIKTTIDNWFSTSNLNTSENLEKIEDAVYCNDRSIDTISGYGNGLGYGTNQTAYNARYRLYTNKTPSLECTNVNDRFTVSDSNGNGELTYPVGLITADEIALAGGKVGSSNSDYYLYTGVSYWASSPHAFLGVAGGFVVDNTGYLNHDYVYYNIYGARPVVSLASGAKILSGGDGTEKNPYVVE